MAHRKSPTKKKWRHDNEKSPRLQAPAAYAREHDELAVYRASNQANTACKEAIGAAIRDHYRDNRLDAAASIRWCSSSAMTARSMSCHHRLSSGLGQALFSRQQGLGKRHVHPRQPDAWVLTATAICRQQPSRLVDLFLSQTRKGLCAGAAENSVRTS